MRWERLFADLEARLAAEDAADLQAEVADRLRSEQAQVLLVDRLRAHRGSPLVLHLAGGPPASGLVVDVGADWCLLEDGPASGPAVVGRGPGTTATAPAGAAVLVPLAVVVSVVGLSRRVAPPAGEVERRTSLGAALRALARDRAPVRVQVPGAELAGTLDRVGADHVDLAVHPRGEARRPGAVREVRAVPLAALLAVRSG